MDDDFEIEGTSVLPIQFLDRTFRGAALQPEKRLQLHRCYGAAVVWCN